MNQPIIEIKNISKKYKLGQSQPYYSLRDSIMEFIKSPISSFKLNKKSSDKLDINEFWALKNISFNIKQGEIVGLIGRNGAGKSTLLKILSRITPPTYGEIILRGSVASLLEIGTGFNPELSGKENIYLNGAILGMTQREIRRKYDEIVNFAEINKFIDMPVKFFSSGMYMRLAFAVSAHLEPDILIIDEVLSVGDANFQKKSLSKIEDLAGQGRTVIFVSHSMMTISKLCKRVILLDDGKIQLEGSVDQVISKYLSKNDTSRAERIWTSNQSAPGDDVVRLRSIKVLNKNNKTGDVFDAKSPVVIELVYYVLISESVFTIGIQLFNSDSILVLSSNDTELKMNNLKRKIGQYKTTIVIPEGLLNYDKYDIRVVMSSLFPKVKHLSEKEVVSFAIKHQKSKLFSNKDFVSESLPGVINPSLKWTTSVV